MTGYDVILFSIGGENAINSVLFSLQSVDWWSLGVLTYELLTGASPFTVDGEKNSQSEISKYVACCWNFDFMINKNWLHKSTFLFSQPQT